MIERTADVGYISSIAKHPRVWPWISEDQDTPEQYTPETDRTVYLKFDGGYMSFRPFTRSCWECHICALPKTIDIPKKVSACLEWMARRGVSHFVAKIPETNLHVLRLARSLGWVEFGRLSECVRRGGEMVGFVMMEYRYAWRNR